MLGFNPMAFGLGFACLFVCLGGFGTAPGLFIFL